MTNDPQLIPVVSLIIGSLALFFSLVSTILWIANRLSTHKIEWRTIGLGDAQSAETLEKQLNQSFEDEEYDAL
jgi:hypothetical protein